MTPVEAAQHAEAIAKKLKVIGDGVTLKEAVVIRVYASLMFEPTASLLNSFMERAEGKVVQPVSGNVGLSWSEFVNNVTNTEADSK